MSKKRVLFISMIAGFSGVLLLFFLLVYQNRHSDGTITVYRNRHGEGSKEVELYLEDDETVLFNVEEQEYDAKELEEVFEKGFSWAREKMLFENKSADSIVSSLYFMSEIPGGISAQWMSSEEEILGSDGTVYNEDWDEEKQEMVMITLTLSCQGEMRTEQIYVHIKAPLLSEKEKRLQKIRRFIKQTEEGTRKKDSFTIPGSIEGIKIREEPPLNPGGLIVIAVAAFLFAVFWQQNRKKEEQKERQKELLLEYPVFVHKMLLYLGAGLSVKSSFEMMLEKYLTDREKGRRKKNAVYEELHVAMNEVGAGIGEKRAYESLGSRLNENQYTRFLALLLQNMEKGNEGLIKSLAKEEELAFTKRLEQAKKAGEEAGTKLLFPMLLLLIVVMIMIMAPAMLQFQNY